MQYGLFSLPLQDDICIVLAGKEKFYSSRKGVVKPTADEYPNRWEL